jgi:hypothetical protein
MDSSNEYIESLSKNIENYEKNVRRRVLLSSMVPFLLGVLLLGYTVWQITIYGKELASVQNELNTTSQALGDANENLRDARSQLKQVQTDFISVMDQLDTTTAELKSARSELKDLRDQLEQITRQLQDANLFIENNVEVDFFAIKEGGLSAGPAQVEVLLYILELQQLGVRWNSTGYSEEEGFNSPSFAVYVLQQCDLYSGPADANTRPWNLSALDASIAQPSIGDLIYYPDSGLTMFYYELNGERFVIGMTPIGILAQNIYADLRPAYLGVPYENYESCFD